MTQEEIQRIEDLVNDKIRENRPVRWYEIPYEEAQQRSDIKQFFGEKYSTKVRVIDIDYSKELCGGTHTAATGHIGLFRIAKESSIAAGIRRRIEAVTGSAAEALMRQSDQMLEQCAATLKTQPAKLFERIEKLLEENKQMAHDLKQAKKTLLKELVHELAGKIENIGTVPTLIAELSVTPEELRSCAEDIMSQHTPLALVLASGAQNKCSIVALVSDDLVGKGVKAQEICKSDGSNY